MTHVLPGHARQMVRNFLVLKDRTVMAGFRIGPVRWDFATPTEKDRLMSVVGDVWAALAGRRVDESVSSRPAPVQTWARNLDARTPHPLPDVHSCGETANRGDLLNGRCGCETWNALLIRQQERIHQIGMDDKVTFRYFSIGTVPAGFDFRTALLSFLEGGKADRRLVALMDEERRVFEIVQGWRRTVRMTEREQGWLQLRTVAPGVQPSRLVSQDMDGWDEMGVAALADDVRWHEEPYDRTLGVRTYANGVRTDSAVRVLHLARVSDLHYPQNGLAPWMTLADRLIDPDGRRFGVEWRMKGRLRHGVDIQSSTDLNLRTALHLKKDYERHDELPSAQVSRAIETALTARDQTASGIPAVSVRFDGTVSVIISGQPLLDEDGREMKSAADVVEGRAAAFARLYAGAGVRQEYVGASVQSYALQSAVPGAPGDRLAFQRRLRIPFLACAMPNVSSSIGDRRGPYMGFTHGGVFQHDPFFATEGRTTGRGQNMHAIVSTLGGGKSVLAGLIVYLNTRRGIKTIVSDPSGPLARIATLPEIAPYAQVIDLLKGRSGVLSPASLVREPDPSDFDAPGLYAEARQEAQAERRNLTLEMARRALPADLYAAPATQRALAAAGRAYSARSSWETTTTFWDLIRALEVLDDPHALVVADGLRDASTAPLLRLMFPPEGGELPSAQVYDKVLTIITTPGIQRPADGVLRTDWNAREVGADAILRLVGLFTERLIFAKDRNERAAAVFDEAEMITDSAAGRSMFSRLGRDHSKHNVAVYLMVKSISDQMMDGELRNFIASVFAGRMANAQPALEALKLLGLEDPAHAQTLMSLSEVQAGQFVHLDVEGQIGAVQIDIEWHRALKAVLLTDPTPEGADAWSLDEEESVL